MWPLESHYERSNQNYFNILNKFLKQPYRLNMVSIGAICSQHKAAWMLPVNNKRRAVTVHLWAIAKSKGHRDGCNLSEEKIPVLRSPWQQPVWPAHIFSISSAAVIFLNASLFLFMLHCEKKPSGATHTHTPCLCTVTCAASLAC